MTVQALTPRLVPEWPRLAWLASCRPGDETVDVLYGPGVEVSDDWLCEAVWDGHFSAGDFDRTDIVAGSGIRLRDARVTFVSSGSTVDRLQMSYALGRLWVSNSLPCLLQAIGAEPDPAYGGYYWDFRTIVQGLRQYERTVATSSAPVQLVYFDNLVWDGWTLRVAEKPGWRAAFTDFAGYRGFLSSSMRAIAANGADGHRKHSFSLLATTSSGYDSPTVTVIAREAGCEEVLSFDRARGRRFESDSGEAIAATLGLRATTVPQDAWRDARLAEAPFIAANAYGEEVHYKGAEALLPRRVLLTGFHGDKVWAKHTDDVYGEIVRGDPTGLALTEYRLHAGFLHCAVPFWGARQVSNIVAVANAREMDRWDVPGDYSRPICRRIVEEAGIPREAFGVSKRAASVILHNDRRFLTEQSLDRYIAWLRAHRADWLRQRRFPPVSSPSLDQAIAMMSLVIGSRQLGRFRNVPGYSQLESRLWRKQLGPTYLRRFLFPWATHEMTIAYRTADPELQWP